MSWKREKQESLTQYVARREQQYLEAQKHGVQLPSLAKGFLLLEGAGLSQQSQANLRTLCSGQLLEPDVMRALRTLDVSSEKEARTYMAEESLGDEVESITSSTAAEIVAELEGLDLDESEAAEVFAVLDKQKKSWSANHYFKQALRKDRSGGLAARAAAGNAPASPAAPAHPGGAPRRKARLSIAELKLVSKCANCGKKGHWHAECREPKRPRPQQQQQQQQQTQSHWAETADNNNLALSTYYVYQGQCGSSEHSWSAAEETATSTFFAGTLGEAMVDCGAGQDLIGLRALQAHSKILKGMGLQPARLTKAPKVASGIGGRAQGLYVVLMPILFDADAVPSFLEVTVLDENVPFLLSAGFLTFLQAQIDMDKNVLHLGKLGCTVAMRRTSGGHCLVDVTKMPHTLPLLIPADELAVTLEIAPDAMMCKKGAQNEVTTVSRSNKPLSTLFTGMIKLLRRGLERKASREHSYNAAATFSQASQVIAPTYPRSARAAHAHQYANSISALAAAMAPRHCGMAIALLCHLLANRASTLARQGLCGEPGRGAIPVSSSSS
eukprot:6490262-Amphidinium_carterae.1